MYDFDRLHRLALSIWRPRRLHERRPVPWLALMCVGLPVGVMIVVALICR